MTRAARACDMSRCRVHLAQILNKARSLLTAAIAKAQDGMDSIRRRLRRILDEVRRNSTSHAPAAAGAPACLCARPHNLCMAWPGGPAQVGPRVEDLHTKLAEFEARKADVERVWSPRYTIAYDVRGRPQPAGLFAVPAGTKQSEMSAMCVRVWLMMQGLMGAYGAFILLMLVLTLVVVTACPRGVCVAAALVLAGLLAWLALALALMGVMVVLQDACHQAEAIILTQVRLSCTALCACEPGAARLRMARLGT